MTPSDQIVLPGLETSPLSKCFNVTVRAARPKTTQVYETYWQFAAERQEIYFRRLSDPRGPWSMDPILARHRFTNAYRAADRVSQFLISEVIYSGSQEPEEVFFRTLLFKFFNRIDTWQHLIEGLGQPTW